MNAVHSDATPTIFCCRYHYCSYAAPELRSSSHTNKVDVFSFGILDGISLLLLLKISYAYYQTTTTMMMLLLLQLFSFPLLSLLVHLKVIINHYFFLDYVVSS